MNVSEILIASGALCILQYAHKVEIASPGPNHRSDGYVER